MNHPEPAPPQHVPLHRRLMAALLAGAVIAAPVLVAGPPPEPPGSEPWPELASATVAERKQRFFDYLRPVVAAENAQIRRERQRLEGVLEHFERTGEVGWLDQRWLEGLAARYRVNLEENPVSDALEILKRRVDIVPVSLALAQAAKESGWGRSRFVREGNNLFGQWCYEPGCGITPRERASGSRHQVEHFDTVRGSVRSYLNNLNSHRSYRALRDLRAELRESGAPVTGVALAEGLRHYSERRGAYVEEVKQMITSNGLATDA